jgi:hypothetical protein
MKLFVAFALLWVSTVATPSAAADVSGFLDAVRADGIVGTPGSVLANGHYVCTTMTAGHGDLQIVQSIVANDSIDFTQARSFVVDAVHYLCPRFESSASPKPPKVVKKVPLPVFNNNVVIHDITV